MLLRWLCCLSLLLLLNACGEGRIRPKDHPPARSTVFDVEPTPSQQPTQPVATTPSPNISAVSTVSVATRSRYALVVGNSTYLSQSLKNPRNDAEDIAAALRQLQFNVDVVLDANQAKMESAIRLFGQRLQSDAVGLFFYAGHAVQYAGENYLIPIGAIQTVSAPEHLKYKTVNAGYIVGVMEQARNGLNILILDACRDNPFRGFSRSINRGLAQMNSPSGTLIAYSTAPGKTAQDGSGRNSPYTTSLLHHIKTPNMPIEATLKKVIADVKHTTRSSQVPWYTTSLDKDFYFAITQ